MELDPSDTRDPTQFDYGTVPYEWNVVLRHWIERFALPTNAEGLCKDRGAEAPNLYNYHTTVLYGSYWWPTRGRYYRMGIATQERIR